jgi:hypothetical protein
MIFQASLEMHMLDERWLLNILATFRPEDEIFDKSYMRPERPSKLSETRIRSGSGLYEIPNSAAAIPRGRCLGSKRKD